MSMRMLIDARHREETRVAVVKGNRVEEFDFESEEHKQLKGNIYLAKVTRVEPSLQAAFIDYGGNRHGFLAFSEIHPDYYQIPKEDREALLREEAEHAAEEEALRAREDEDFDEGDGGDGDDADPADEIDAIERLDDDGAVDGLDAAEDYDEEGERPAPKPTVAGSDDGAAVESLRQKRMNLRRRYKIQDVIRRRQVLLVQVVKEERGNKGAALTTYLSLAGRYCVLMPNTSHGGGISRKISNGADRKRLKSIMAELNLPRTMGCIVRTAGLQRTRDEIRRDFDYLARLWDEIRERTLGSSAPAEIYRDSDLVKRAIRDIYSKDIDEVIVEGEDGYHAARSFMKLLMPGQARKIAPYSDAVPLFQRHGVEDQLGAMYQPVVQLKSGGYIVINPTEALVSIDINSGRSTREHNVEQTALSTNLEAAHEIARQLRLRDMAGLIVIDFIDMEVMSNNRKVEKAIKEALRHDRARIQVGRISSFGLFEMSRQRLRTGMLEASTRICPHCEGSGFIRTASSSGLQALRLLEEEAARGRGSQLRLTASHEAALYVLNRKRVDLADIEERYGVAIEVASDGTPEGARMTVEAGGPPPAHAPRLPAPVMREADDDLPEETDDEPEAEFVGDDQRTSRGEEGGDRRRRRRRRRGGRRDEEERGAGTGETVADESEQGETAGEVGDLPVTAGAIVDTDDLGSEMAESPVEEGRSRGRRGRRGGRRGRRGDAASGGEEAPSSDLNSGDPQTGDVQTGDVESGEEIVAMAEAWDEPAPTPEQPATEGQSSTEGMTPAATDESLAVAEAEAIAPGLEPEAPARPRRRPRARKPADGEAAAMAVTAPVESLADAMLTEAAPTPKPRRRKAAAAPVAGDDAADDAVADDVAAKPRRSRRKSATTEQAPAPAVISTEPAAEVEPAPELPLPATDEPAAVATTTAATTAATTVDDTADAPTEPARRGWWQRTFGN